MTTPKNEIPTADRLLLDLVEILITTTDPTPRSAPVMMETLTYLGSKYPELVNIQPLCNDPACPACTAARDMLEDKAGVACASQATTH